MRFHLLLAGAFACLSFGVAAAECEFPYDTVVGEFADAGAPVMEVPADALPDLVEQIEADMGEEYGNVQRGFIAQVGGKLLLGLEVDDSLIEPIVVGTLDPASAPLSGKGEGGRVGA